LSAVQAESRFFQQEHAISTFKDHFIASLCSTDPLYPLNLWDKLIPQSNITLNLLHCLHINPQLLAYAQVFGAFDFNKTPLAPPRTCVLVHEKPDIWQSWDPQVLDTWYLGPAMHHIWNTKSKCVADTLAWFPTRVKMPTISSLDLALAAACDLLAALQNPSPGSPLAPTTDSQAAALKQLVEIFQVCTQHSPLLIANNSASTTKVLDTATQQQTTQLLPTPSQRVGPSTPPLTVPPGFNEIPTTHPSLQPPTTATNGATLLRMPATDSSLTATPGAPATTVQPPRVSDPQELLQPPLQTYENTAIGSTQQRNCTKKTTTALPLTPKLHKRKDKKKHPVTPTHVANTTHMATALKVSLPDPSTTSSSNLLHQLEVELAIPKGFAFGIICPITRENQEY
jgi:hypothetical protein